METHSSGYDCFPVSKLIPSSRNVPLVTKLRCRWQEDCATEVLLCICTQLSKAGIPNPAAFPIIPFFSRLLNQLPAKREYSSTDASMPGRADRMKHKY